VEVAFFDCDDCLYFDDWAVANQITRSIEEWCIEHAGLGPGDAYGLYKEHGTALRGLMETGLVGDGDGSTPTVERFLHDVHDLDPPVTDTLRPDAELRDMLRDMDPRIRKYVFTASAREHAERCLEALGISDQFVDIIDTRSCGLHTKHSPEAFRRAMECVGVNSQEDDLLSCVFLDDSVKNIRTAKRVGWRSVLVGRKGRDDGEVVTAGGDAEHEVDRVHQLREIMPELFVAKEGRS